MFKFTGALALSAAVISVALASPAAAAVTDSPSASERAAHSGSGKYRYAGLFKGSTKPGTPQFKRGKRTYLRSLLASASPAAGYITESGDRLAPRRYGPTGELIRRDGASAVPFEPSVGLLSAHEAADAGFDLGDAALGAGAGILASLLVAGGVAAAGIRRTSDRTAPAR